MSKDFRRGNHQATKVDSLIAEDGFTVSLKDLVLVDGREMCVEEMWSDGEVFAGFPDGEMKELNIDDIELSVPGSLMVSNH
mgnify:CR=1 FL=1